MEVYQPPAATGGAGAPSALLYAQSAESADCDPTGAEGDFNLAVFDIPAGSLSVGDVLEIDAGFTSYAAPGFHNCTFRVRSLLVQLVSFQSMFPPPGYTFFRLAGTVQAIGVNGKITWSSFRDGFANLYQKVIDTPVDTTGIITLHATGQWSGNDAGNSAKSHQFNVKKFRV